MNEQWNDWDAQDREMRQRLADFEREKEVLAAAKPGTPLGMKMLRRAAGPGSAHKDPQ